MVAGAAADPFAEEKIVGAAPAATVQAPEDDEPADAWDASESSDDESAAWDSRTGSGTSNKAGAAGAGAGIAAASKRGTVKGLWAAAAAPHPKPASKLPAPEPEPDPELNPETELLRILSKGGPVVGAEEDAVTCHLNALHRGKLAESTDASNGEGGGGGKKKSKRMDKQIEGAFEMAVSEGSLGVTLLRLLFHSQDNQPTGVLAWLKTSSHTALLQRLCPSPADQQMLWSWCVSKLDELPPVLSWLGEKSPNAASKLLLLLYNEDVVEVG